MAAVSGEIEGAVAAVSSITDDAVAAVPSEMDGADVVEQGAMVEPGATAVSEAATTTEPGAAAVSVVAGAMELIRRDSEDSGELNSGVEEQSKHDDDAESDIYMSSSDAEDDENERDEEDDIERDGAGGERVRARAIVLNHVLNKITMYIINVYGMSCLMPAALDLDASKARARVKSSRGRKLSKRSPARKQRFHPCSGTAVHDNRQKCSPGENLDENAQGLSNAFARVQTSLSALVVGWSSLNTTSQKHTLEAVRDGVANALNTLNRDTPSHVEQPWLVRYSGNDHKTVVLKAVLVKVLNSELEKRTTQDHIEMTKHLLGFGSRIWNGGTPVAPWDLRDTTQTLFNDHTQNIGLVLSDIFSGATDRNDKSQPRPLVEEEDGEGNVELVSRWDSVTAAGINHVLDGLVKEDHTGVFVSHKKWKLHISQWEEMLALLRHRNVIGHNDIESIISLACKMDTWRIFGELPLPRATCIPVLTAAAAAG